MTVRRNNTAPAAGPFDVEDEFQFKGAVFVKGTCVKIHEVEKM